MTLSISRRCCFTLPGMVSGLLELDEFRKRFPNTAIAPVGQAMFLASLIQKFCRQSSAA